jgi:hypothetical protein
MIVVDGNTYDVPIVSAEDSLEFLDKYAERTENGKLRRELIGTFPKQTIVFGAPLTAAQRTAYTALWEKLGEPVEFHNVEIPDADGVPFAFLAYVSGLRRTLRKVKEAATYWKAMSVTFTAQGPKATP